MTVDGSNSTHAEHPQPLSEHEQAELRALRRRFEENSPQGFTDSDGARFDRITHTLGVPRFPVDREALLDVVRRVHGADSVLVAVKSLPEGARFASYDELLLALGIGMAGRVDVPGAPPRDPEGGAPSLAG